MLLLPSVIETSVSLFSTASKNFDFQLVIAHFPFFDCIPFSLNSMTDSPKKLGTETRRWPETISAISSFRVFVSCFSGKRVILVLFWENGMQSKNGEWLIFRFISSNYLKEKCGMPVAHFLRGYRAIHRHKTFQNLSIHFPRISKGQLPDQYGSWLQLQKRSAQCAVTISQQPVIFVRLRLHDGELRYPVRIEVVSRVRP